MKWLLSKLGLLRQEKNTQTLTKDLSFLKASAKSNTITCEWGLRKQTQQLISQNQGTTLMIRIRDASGDGTIANKSIEIGRHATQAQIDTPFPNGLILLELGYKTPEGDFITLEYTFIDLGPKKCTTPELTNWFTNESKNIHQEMYDLATRGVTLGGSERIRVEQQTTGQ